MKRAVMYGGGNIGRGFIGPLFAEAGYQVTFIDVSPVVVETLQREHSYPLRIIADEGHEDLEISGVDAINGNDSAAAAEAIAAADIMATAVGANILRHIAPNIAAGLKLRFERGSRPLDILICENLMDANQVLEQLVKQYLTVEEQRLFDLRVGLVEASIGRMVPVQTPAMQDGRPLRVCVERYGYLPVDRDAFKGPIPAIKNLVPSSPFSFYLKRKLYIHNLGHAVCAYLGLQAGHAFIHEAVEDPQILLIARCAMEESLTALAKEYPVPATDLLNHIDDLLTRFTNVALQDTCARVAQDPRRKLAPSDRLVGAAVNCLNQGVFPAYILIGIAAALQRLLVENGQAVTETEARAALETVSGLSAGHPLAEPVLRFFRMIQEGAGPSALRQAARRLKKINSPETV